MQLLQLLEAHHLLMHGSVRKVTDGSPALLCASRMRDVLTQKHIAGAGALPDHVAQP